MININDAAAICRPLDIPERPLDPPTTYWTDADERDYARWLAARRDELEREFLRAEDDRFEEFCRDKFDEENAP